MSCIRLARLDKPWGILLLAWPTFSALLLLKVEDIKIWMVFSVGIVLTRSAGCVINDYADIKLDGLVSRTKNRPLVLGDIKPYQALVWFSVLMGLSASLLYFLNHFARLLAVLSAGLLCLYPYTKRFLRSPQSFLGIAFSMGAPMVYANANHPFDLQFWGFLGITVLWVVVYDTIYSMEDQKDDQKMNVHSMAITLGRKTIPFVTYAYGLIWVLWGIWGLTLSWVFYISWVFLGMNYYQQIKDVQKSRYFKAFLSNQYAGIWVMLGIALSQYGGI